MNVRGKEQTFCMLDKSRRDLVLVYRGCGAESRRLSIGLLSL